MLNDTTFNGAIDGQTTESTCGVNERRDVACYKSSHPTEYAHTKPVARLLIGGRSLCTGWRVGNDNHMFTNNHCIENKSELASTENWFNYQRSNCGSGSKGPTVKVGGAKFFKTDKNPRLHSIQCE